MEEIFTEREQFKKRIFLNIQSELDQFGLKIYNANVKEVSISANSVFIHPQIPIRALEMLSEAMQDFVATNNILSTHPLASEFPWFFHSQFLKKDDTIIGQTRAPLYSFFTVLMV